jgi:AraC-like DNA-binding protein
MGNERSTRRAETVALGPDQLVAAPPSNPTISSTALAPFMRLLEELGPEATASAVDGGAAVLARWGIAQADLAADPTMRVPHGLAMELLEVFIAVAGDPSAALRAGLKLQRGDYELLEYLCGSCDTLGASIACLSHYYPLLIAAELSLSVTQEPGLPTPPAINEFALASNFAMAILHLELSNALAPIEVMFAHPAPSYHAVFEQVFGVPVRFGCEHNALVFQPAMLAHPFRDADPILHAVLTRLADQELLALAERSAFPNKVAAAIEQTLAQGAALDAVAALVHLSASGLRSRLRQHGTTYSDLLDRVRKTYAKRALHDTQVGIAELAHRLGFAHPPAFHRAFRRWFGVTPNAYREVRSEHPAARFWRKD